MVSLSLSLSLSPLIKHQSFCALVFSTHKFVSYLLTARNTETPPGSQTQDFYFSPFTVSCQSTHIQWVLLPGDSQPEPCPVLPGLTFVKNVQMQP